MTNRSQFESDCRSAEKAKAATIQTAVNTQQESINAVGVNIGANPMLGVTAAHDATIRAANATFQGTALTAEHLKQVTITNSRASNLQNNGDTGAA